MPDETLLSDLCSICNVNESKYRCPGCSARTCSLPCYKRHQQWAQCSGQRDRTKFMKKSQLVTPAGIDHDFNFLTSIERDIEKAEQGLAKSSDRFHSTERSSSSQSSPKDQTQYNALQAAGVRVIRAPKGMSRQKENKSHRSNTKRALKNITWTVEWLDDQKRRQLTQTSSTIPLIHAQPFQAPGQYKAKKRKRHFEPSLTESSSVVQDDKTPRSTQDQLVESIKPIKLDVNVDISTQKREHPFSRGRRTNSNEEENTTPKTNVEETHRTDPGYDGANTEPLGTGGHRFFLVMPRTNSSRTVLIPLNPTATLDACLAGRTVVEFPTIYVFTCSDEPSPAEFMFEEDYLKQEGEEQKEFDQLISELDPKILRRLKDDEQFSRNRTVNEEKLDDKEILDVLKKDFGSFL